MNRNWHLTFLLMILLLLPVGAQDYGTGLKEVPDKLQQSFAQAQPAGLVTSDGAAPGDDCAELGQERPESIRVNQARNGHQSDPVA